MIPENHIWIFNNGGPFPGGVFTTIERAEAWIEMHQLTGVLTAYPVDEGCFDWAVRESVTNLQQEKVATKSIDPHFIGGFSTASKEHFHYESGKRSRTAHGVLSPRNAFLPGH